MFRPQKKRQEQQQKLMANLKTGDRVVTNSGIHGLISNVKDTTVIVKVADNVKIEMEKSAVTTVLKSAEA
jgi:preprotein translocase subunit YajC